ncbi:hypothetical protein FRX31_012048 [Thalictrum thalictroides]|uniref:Uncharacterized protein n=1 Tax=Thalictrum thalictroides TaxID=46969 RepID=A0A7J6WPI7_THATH|nr:hypothetical protein FRX31_012048 [Thalictrum thalictroides]
MFGLAHGGESSMLSCLGLTTTLFISCHYYHVSNNRRTWRSCTNYFSLFSGAKQDEYFYAMDFENRANARPNDSVIKYNGFVIGTISRWFRLIECELPYDPDRSPGICRKGWRALCHSLQAW